MSTLRDGPYLGMAILCERVLQEKDNVLSAIRIVDKIIQTTIGADSVEMMPPVTINLFAIISFKSGRSGGKYNFKLVSTTPSNEKMQEYTIPLVLEKNGKSANVIINLNLLVKEEGLYWFDVLLNDKFITKIPLHIEYQRVQMASSLD
jgi:hypothetical protein